MHEREKRDLIHERVKRETGKYPWEGQKFGRAMSFEEYLDKAKKRHPRLDVDEIIDEIWDRLR